MYSIDKAFPEGLFVKHKESNKYGFVQKDFGGAAVHYDPWEIPVIWLGEKILHGVNCEKLIRYPILSFGENF